MILTRVIQLVFSVWIGITIPKNFVSLRRNFSNVLFRIRALKSLPRHEVEGIFRTSVLCSLRSVCKVALQLIVVTYSRHSLDWRIRTSPHRSPKFCGIPRIPCAFATQRCTAFGVCVCADRRFFEMVYLGAWIQRTKSERSGNIIELRSTFEY